MCRRPARGVTLLVAALVVAGCMRQPEPRPFRNLVVVLVDTLRSDHLPSYGYPRGTAPFLTRLAAEGVQLQGYSASSWTRPSVATLLTGLAPQRHQAIERLDALPETVPYLPQLLAEQGFTTAAVIGNLVVSRQWGFGRGVSLYRNVRPRESGKAEGIRVTRRAVALLDRLAPPFFLYVHYVDPHDPYRPEEPWLQEGEEPWDYVQPRRLLRNAARLDGPTIHRLVGQYDGEILAFDRQLERLVEALRMRDLLQDTLVVVTSDHGEEFGEHGGLIHGRTLYREVLEVPFVLWSSDGLPRYRSAERLHHVDFLPTALDSLGLDAPRGIDGESRWQGIFGGEPQAPDELFFHLDLDRRGALALLRPPWKLIHTPVPPHDRLFRLDLDPSESVPRAEAEREALLRRLLGHHNLESADAYPRSIEAMDAEQRRTLAALGYIDLDTPEQQLRRRVIPDRLDPERGFAGD